MLRPSLANSQERNLKLFLILFIGILWTLLIVKIIFYTVDASSSFFFISLVDNVVLAVLLPALIIYFHKQFWKHIVRQESEYKELFKKNPHAMWVYDIHTLRFLMTNQSATVLYGYTMEEFLRMKISDIRPLEDVPALLEDVAKSNETFDQKPYNWAGVWRHKKKDGSLIYAEISSHNIMYNGKKSALVLSYDVTEKVMQELKLQTVNQSLERKVKERTHDLLHLNKTLVEQNKTIKTVNNDLALLGDELREANEKIKEHADLKSRFVSMVSHEFRTPLSTIRFAAEFISRYNDMLKPEQVLEKAKSIGKQVVHMDAMLTDILTIGKDEAGKINTVIEHVELLPFLNGLINEVRQATNHTHEIQLDLGIVPLQIQSDEKLLRNIFINLLSNAIKYSPDKNVVFFKVETVGAKLTFQVQDLGMGLGKQDLTKIFDPFYRTTEVKHIQGTGLGLSIVKRAVELMSGTISVESEPGKGSTFHVTLPI